MAETYSITAELQAKIDGFVDGFKQAKSVAEDFVNKNQKTFDSFKQVGAAATAGGVAIAAGLGGAVKIAADFEAQMSTVGAISGATGSDLKALSQKAQEMGANTKFSATQSAEAFEHMARMGWKTTDMLSGIEGVMALASAGGVELADAANITASSLSMFGMKAEESARVADVLAAVASNTGTDVLSMGESLKMVGPSANAAGMEIEETAAFIGLLADNSILGSSAGTTMNAMLRDMKKNAKNGAIAIGDASVKIYDAEGNMRGFSDIIADVEGATKGMTTAQRDAALMSIFGDEAMRGLNVALGSGSKELKRIEADMRNAKGTAADMSAQMEDNLNGAITSLSSAIEGAAISIGSALIPVIRKVAEYLKSLVDRFNAFDENAKTIIAIVAALSAGFLLLVGPILMLVGFIPSMLAGFTALSTVFAAITGPIGLTIAAIIAIGAALVIAYNKFEWFRDIVDAIWQTIVTVIMSAVDGIVAFVKNIADQISTYWNENGELIRSATENVWNAIKAVIETVMPIIEKVISVVWKAIQTVVLSVWENIKSVISGALDIILGLVKTFAGLFTGDWSAMWDGIKQMFSGAVEFLWNLIQLMLWGRLLKGISAFAGAFRGAATTMWNAIRGVFTGAVTAIRNFFTNGFNAMRNVANTSMSSMRSIISTVWNTIKSVFTTVVSALRTTVSTGFQNVVNAIQTRMTSAVNAVRTKMSDMLSKVKEYVSKFFNAGKDLIQGLIDGIKNMTSAAIGAITGVVDGVVNKAKSLLGIKSPSRVFSKFGGFISEGLADGINKTARLAVKASEALSLGVEDAFNPHLAVNGVDIAGQVNSINQRANRRLTSHVKSELVVSKNDVSNTASGSINQTVNIYSPTPLSPSEAARKQKQASRDLINGWRR